MAARVWLRLALVAASLVTAGGCAQSHSPVTRPATTPEIAVRRGAGWTAFTLKGTRIVGPSGSLEFNRGKLLGSIDERTIRMEIAAGMMTGIAGGRVALDFHETNGIVEVSGVWNDDRVHFQITPESLRGTITGAILGQCQYVLDRTLADGARAGISICSGMPQETRLEVPPVIDKWLTFGERLAAILVVLSSPPISSSD